MPRFPTTKDWGTISSRPFSKYAKFIEKMGKPKFPLHIGDTYLAPPKSAEFRQIDSEYDDIHKYCAPKGHPVLVAAISEKYDVSPDQVMVVPGATAGLHVAAMATLQPGDKVLILAPFWPLAKGIIQAVGAIPVCVPFFTTDGSVADRIRPYMDDQTVAVYCNSPNNPTGAMLTQDEAQELASLVQEQDWWLFSDEVYERLIYHGQNVSLRTLAPKNTISLYSFSKAYAMAGYRCGYLILPSASLEEHFLKGIVHSFYSVSTPAQLVGADVLKQEDAWIENTRQLYVKAGAAVADVLNVAHPTNGTFIFMDVSKYLGSRTFDQFMEACIEQKLLLAPGSAFGDGYENCIRICFTCVDLPTAIEGAQILKDVLES